MVFVATPSRDVRAAADDLAAELVAQGYDVRPDGPIDEFYSDRAIRELIEPAVLSVHVLGRAVDATRARQLQLAQELGKRIVIWLPEEEAQRSQSNATDSLIQEFFKRGAGRPVATVLTGSIRAMIQDVLGLLAPRPSELEADIEVREQPTVYLLCDASAPEDSAFASSLGRELRKKEGFNVLLPSAATATSMDSHHRSLRESDGVLLYRNTAPLQWLKQNLPDVMFADRLERRSRPLRSKAFVIDDPDLLTGFPNVIPTKQFTVDTLEPFLAPLRSSGGGNVHA